MNTSEILKSLAKRLEKQEEEVELVFKAAVKTFRENLINHNYFRIPNFGSFDTTERSHRLAYNPHFKKKMIIPNKVVAVFRPSKALQNKVK
jgi:nucleoid DNA-binding protein